MRNGFVTAGFVFAVLVPSIVAGCSREDGAPQRPAPTPGETPPSTMVDDVTSPAPVRSGEFIPSRNDEMAVQQRGTRLIANMRDRRAARTASVELPTRADGAFRVVADRIGRDFSVSVRAVGAAPAQAAVKDGIVSYAGAYGRGTTMVQVPKRVGTEDYVRFEGPTRDDLRYTIELGEDVAGLRLVSNTLELLDAAGAPRLRVPSPYGVDAEGKRFGARLAVEGCAVDTDPRMPFDRPVTSPGARSCAVVVSWTNPGLAFPIAVDPAWTTTGDMTDPSATWELPLVLLSGGKVLAVPNYTKAQIYDPATGTWTATQDAPINMTHRSRMVAVDANKAFATGGYGYVNPNNMQKTALYDLATGMWTAKSDTPNTGAATDGKALVHKGGNVVLLFDNTGTVHEYDVATDTYTPKTAAGQSLGYNTAAWKVGNVVYTQGGNVNVLSKYDIAGDAWTFYTTNLFGPSSNTGQLEPLSDGKLLVYGACGAANYAAVFDPATDTKTDVAFPAAPNIECNCFRTTNVSSNVTFAAGKKHLIGAGRFLYDEATGMITDNGPMASGNDVPSVVVKLPDGRALAAGWTFNHGNSNKTDLFGPSEQADCATGQGFGGTSRPVFDATNLVCAACGSDNGGATLACPTTNEPVCNTTGALAGRCTACSPTKVAQCTGMTPGCDATTGACAASTGDYGTTTAVPCPTAANPYAKADGSCGKCTANADCAGATHGGPICNVTTGACGTTCAADADCANGKFCDTAGTKTCIDKKADGAACTRKEECGSGACTNGKCGSPAADGGTSSSSSSSGGSSSGGSSSSGGAADAGSSSGDTTGGGGDSGCSVSGDVGGGGSGTGLAVFGVVAALFAGRGRRRRDA